MYHHLLDHIHLFLLLERRHRKTRTPKGPDTDSGISAVTPQYPAVTPQSPRITLQYPEIPCNHPAIPRSHPAVTRPQYPTITPQYSSNVDS